MFTKVLVRSKLRPVSNKREQPVRNLNLVFNFSGCPNLFSVHYTFYFYIVSIYIQLHFFMSCWILSMLPL